MSNVYENCPTLENNNYIIRLIDEKDAADLLKSIVTKEHFLFSTQITATVLIFTTPL